MKKTITLLILLVMILSALASCGTETVVEETETPATETAETETLEETAVPEVSDDLPKKDFEGRTFSMITYNDIASDLIAPEVTGDVVNDAVFARNATVAERFNVVLETKGDFAWDEIPAYVRRSVQAGEDAFQLSVDHMVSFSGLVCDGLLMNWYDIPYIDFSKPWWSQSTVEDMSYMGKATPLAIGDLSLSSIADSLCYYFDKGAVVDYGLEDMYTVVNEGRWTIDYVMEITNDIYLDLNGNNERDMYDFYGLSQCKTSPVDGFLFALGGKIIEIGADGVPTYVYGDEKTVAIFEKVWKLCHESDGVCIDREYSAVHYTADYAFLDGLSVFASGKLSSGSSFFRDREGEYGIIPYPKFDEAQQEYLTLSVSPGILAVPKTVSDQEFVGIIIEALNAESHKQVLPVYYETALKAKYVHDSDSAKMVDLVREGRVFDMGYVYDNWKGVGFQFERLIQDENENIVSYIERNDRAARTYYDKVLSYLASMAEGNG